MANRASFSGDHPNLPAVQRRTKGWLQIAKMALAHTLAQAGNPPEHLDVEAKVTLDQRDGAPTVTSSELTVRGRVPGIDQAGFEEAADDAGKNCPISRALGGVEITVNATLDS